MSKDLSESLGLQTMGFSLYDDGVAVVQLDVPGETHNVLSPAVAEDLDPVLGFCEGQSSVRALVIASAKARSFIVGADIKQFDSINTASEAAALSRSSQRLMERLEQLHLEHDKPVVAAIDGPALGGGFEVALACSHRVCAREPSTTMGLPEVKLGLIPGAGGTQRLPRLIGIANALDLILTGKNVRPKRAAALGLVDEVVPAAIVVEVACELALKVANGRIASPKRGAERLVELAQDVTDPSFLQQLALEDNSVGQHVLFRRAGQELAKQTQGNYPAPLAALDVIKTGIQEGLEAGYESEAERFGSLMMSPESEALRSIYFGQNALKKDPGVANPVEPRAVDNLYVLGGGLMGAGVAYVSATKARVPVRIKEVGAQGMQRALRYVRGVLDKDRKRRRLSAYELDRTMSFVTATTEWHGVGAADVVIEAVFEELELKREMLRTVEQHGHSEVIFASNTSSIPIASIAAAASHPERVIGMHYFSPVEKMPLLEIVTTEKTADWVTATCVALGKAQGKTVIVVRDGAGFYTSRILAPYMNEAAWLFAEGVSLDAIDKAMTSFGFPVGPITLMDEVGIDVGAKVGAIMQGAFGERMKAPEVMETVVKDGRHGRKSGRGFYRYSDGVRDGIDRSIYKLLPRAERVEVSVEEIQDRMILQMVNEAARCLTEGILRNARDGDIGAVFGLGFPPFLGGPFSYIDRRGAVSVCDRLSQLRERYGVRFEVASNLDEIAKSGSTFR